MIASGLQLLDVVDAFVDLLGLHLHLSFLVLDVFSQEVHEVDRSLFFELIEDLALELGEGLQTDLVDVVLDLVLLLIVSELVDEHTLALVTPQSDQEDLRLEAQSAS